jgi:hypothetical protein
VQYLKDVRTRANGRKTPEFLKLKFVVIAIVIFSAFSGSRSEYHSSLNDYLKSFLEDCLPLEKYISSVNWDAWKRDCVRYPRGKPDPRGESLFRNVQLMEDPHSLDIFFVGLLHIPLFHRELSKSGFKPYLICWHFQEEMNEWDPFYILRDLRRDPLSPPELGEPCIIIGDRHGKDYRIAFPDPVMLKEKNINKVHFYIELLECDLEAKSQLVCLKNAMFGEEIFWGQRKIYGYIQELKRHGMEVLIEGIEPPKYH